VDTEPSWGRIFHENRPLRSSESNEEEGPTGRKKIFHSKLLEEDPAEENHHF
jgi:hypothetical protein